MVTISSKQVENYRNVAISAVLLAGAGTGLFFLGRNIYRKVTANVSQNNSLTEGDPATYAKQLKMAFENDMWFGMGTDEKTVMAVFREIPSKSMYGKVQREYNRMYNRNLNSDLEDELESDEYNEVIEILKYKP